MIVESVVLRTAVFQSEYDLSCNSLDDPLTKDYLQTLLEHKTDEMQKFCGTGLFVCLLFLLCVSLPI